MGASDHHSERVSEYGVRPIEVLPIATVHNGIAQPQTSGWDRVQSRITIVKELDAEMLADLVGFSHVLVLFWLDRLGADRPRPSRLAVGDKGAERGILATRSQLRPNPIGVTVVTLQAVEGRSLRVLGLDALDGTPVLDLKPYIPHYDSVPAAKVPAWVYGR